MPEHGEFSSPPHGGVTVAGTAVEGATVTVGSTPAGGPAPEQAPGLNRLGQFSGSGLREPVHLVRRADGQVVQLSALLSFVLEAVDGHASIPDIAASASAASGRPVSPDNVCYLLDHRLVPLGLVTAPDGTTTAPRASHLLVLTARRTLIPAGVVGVIARTFAPLFHPAVAVAMLSALLVADTWIIWSVDLLDCMRAVLATPTHLLAVFGIIFASMVFHEWGHAAACRYGGGRPGRIGCGLYLVWPALYTDVTDAYRLDRAGRLRTDLGGLYFNAVSAVAVAAAWAVTGSEVFVAAAMLIHFEALQQLLPIMRFDGYYILGDLAGVPDLFGRMRPVFADTFGRARDRVRRCRTARAAGRSGGAADGSDTSAHRPPPGPRHPAVAGLTRWSRITITAWVFVTAPLLAANLVLIVLVAPSLLATTVRSTGTTVESAFAAIEAGEVVTGLAAVACAAILALPALGVAVLLTRLGMHGARAARSSCRDRPGRTAVVTIASAATAVALVTYWSWRGV